MRAIGPAGLVAALAIATLGGGCARRAGLDAEGPLALAPVIDPLDGLTVFVDPETDDLPVVTINGARQPLILNAGDGFQFEPEEGIVSFYQDGYLTACGDRFDLSLLAAAHNSLPFGAVARCTLPDTGASVIVTINDRGPHVPGRILDLTRGAAERLGLVDRGIAPCRLEVLAYPAAAGQTSAR